MNEVYIVTEHTKYISGYRVIAVYLNPQDAHKRKNKLNEIEEQPDISYRIDKYPAQ